MFQVAGGSSVQVFSEDHETFFFQITDPSELVDVFHYNIKSKQCYPEDIKAEQNRAVAIAFFLGHFCFEIG